MSTLTLKGLTKHYSSSDKALTNVSLSVNAGEVVGLIGPSGAGKSTLIRCINRLTEPTSGEVIFSNTNLETLSKRQLRQSRREIGMIFQEYALIERLTVMENVLSGRLGYVNFWQSFTRRFPESDIQAAYALLDRVGLLEHANKRADALSGGQRQRVGIARALAQKPKLLLIDEPTAALDPRTARQIMRLISEICSEQQLPAIINIHDVQLAKQWTKPPLISSPWLRWSLIIVVAVYLYLATQSVDVNWARIYEGSERGLQFIMAFMNPDFSGRWDNIYQGLIESLTMTLTSTVAGVILSIPFGLGAAKNLAPTPIYLFCRGFISIARSLQEIIVAILCVALFGFGTFAGFVTLTFVTIGFLAKLFADEIEAIDPAPLTAMRATDASWLQQVNYAIQAQVMPRFIGLSMYRLDINFRESAVIGIVGAGGIGATLNTAMDRYEYSAAVAILLIIIVIVMLCEYLSTIIRKHVQ
ncbi:Phosphonates import ATP-binding protein PhnC (modular protein) [Vibrio chagasii]|uniref:phosphonate ABC transporter ATP-binding protein n=1 Tax=Vibrio chagasii TaxID=170679 RepID=UPI0023D8934A|nr:phosphonate ABC transporter ATP-binding protein [Vibrio chagasii]CAH6898447.1 Phosphonates import ATP-binding protein PhnC (modular protein) [Vibrio chagasii]CAH6906665.1 Phosphonates import ATP-binding protein PhnC (modular protein) [Vibrio chagasii]CAH6926316.1 Phosphonates import ATP-binding protein PhnC (modular protein) [Vibrio chagasii]CAH7140188.1 Phosphonates import ATP-binding protein PhnC (modular protein) [Vibrio chagasii]CAH7257696.1 Phosphonates import ATP-binding protein PhnC 